MCVLSTAELVTKLYEAAVKKVPLSEEYHSHLFMAYARVGEYKKMQQVRQLKESTYEQQAGFWAPLKINSSDLEAELMY